MNSRTIKSYLKEHAFSYFLLGASLLFYLFFACYDGVFIAVDSESYIGMSVTREAFYPAFLAVLRSIWGDGTQYLFIAVLLQSLLAAFSAWILEEYLRKEIAAPKWFSVILLAIPLMVSLLCRFAAQRASMYSNSIMTEGIAIALYLIAIREVFEFLLYQTRKSLWITVALSIIMISTRKQMYVVLALLALSIIIISFLVKTDIKGFFRSILKAAVISAIVLIGVSGFDKAYNYVVRGEVVGHSSDIRFLMTMVFYTGEEADAQYIEDTQLRELFLDIYRTCEEQGYTGNCAEQGWLNEVSHFGDHYDHIQIDTMWPMLHDYVDSKNESLVKQEAYMDREIETDRIMRAMIRDILPHDYPRILKALWNNFLSGLVTTVAQRTPVLIWYSVLAYGCYIALLIYNFIYNRLSKTNLFACLVLMSVLGNVLVVSAVIFCQTRYTIYNMALFYIAGLLLLYEAVQTFWKRRVQKQAEQQ